MKQISATSVLMVLALSVLSACAPVPEATPAPAPSSYQPTPEEQAVLKLLVERQSLEGFKEGIAIGEKFLAENPGARQIPYAIGVLNGLADRHSEALAAFKMEIERDPGHIASYRGAATAEMSLGRPDAAIERLEQALRIDPENPSVLFELGRSLSNAGRFDESESILNQAATHGSSAAHVELGILLRRQGRLPEAAEMFSKALQQNPKELSAMLNLGQTWIALGRPAEGQALLRRHAEQATLKDRIDIHRRSSLLEGATAGNFRRLARLQVRSRSFLEAAQSYEEALRIAPRSTEATIGLAAIFMQDGQMGEATKWTLRTLMIDPDSSKAYYLLGMIRLSKGQTTEALQAFETSQKYKPWNSEELRVVGDSLRGIAELDLASSFYQKAIDLNPATAPGHYGQGLTQILLGQPSIARSSLTKAIRLNADDSRSHLLLGLLLHLSGELEAADVEFQSATKLHRLDLLAGKKQDLIAPFSSIPSLQSGLQAYRETLGQ